MVKPDFTIERFLEIVVPGAILSIGLWYVNRPFLSVYFPTVASMGEAGPAEPTTLASKASIFLCVTLVLGMLLRNFADIVVGVSFDDEISSEQSNRLRRRLLRALLRAMLLGAAGDPRIAAVDRYLQSTRKHKFLEMAQKWGFHSEPTLTRDGDKVLVHQQLVVRLKIISPETRALVTESMQPVNVFSAVLIGLLVLLGSVIFSVPLNDTVSHRAGVHSGKIVIIILAVVYGLTFIVAYALRRAMKQFSSRLLTLALHYFDERVKQSVEAPAVTKDSNANGARVKR